MPLYEYQCDACGRFELIQKLSDDPLSACPTCGRAVQKLLSAPAIQFKGSGWYVTDYARKSGGDGASGSGSDSSTTKDAKASGDSKDSKTSGDSKAPAESKDSSTPQTSTSKDSSASSSSSSK